MSYLFMDPAKCLGEEIDGKKILDVSIKDKKGSCYIITIEADESWDDDTERFWVYKGDPVSVDPPDRNLDQSEMDYHNKHLAVSLTKQIGKAVWASNIETSTEEAKRVATTLQDLFSSIVSQDKYYTVLGEYTDGPDRDN